MLKLPSFLSLSLIVASVGCLGVWYHHPSPKVEVRFSPNGEVASSIIRNIDAAHQKVWVQAFSFTSTPIVLALVRAQERGVDVEAILDRDNLKNEHSVLQALVDGNITVYIDKSHAIAHNKVMVIDHATVITGSYNFTNSAEERNAENSLVITDEKINSQYSDNWKLHQEHSHKYE